MTVESKALLEFTSHIDGKNAYVTIFPDRVEWDRKGRVTLTRLAGASMTMGASLLATGVRTGGSSEMIPIKNITSVTSGKDGLRFHKVTITASNAEIEFRVDKAIADAAKTLISQLMLGSHQSQTSNVSQPVIVVPTAPSSESESDKFENLKKLKDLLDAGVLTDEEFQDQKRRLLDL